MIKTALPFLMSILPLAANYQWSSVPIGGGGYVTGVVVHPRERALVYIRTDVGGAYRWSEPADAGGRHWIPLSDFVTWENGDFVSIDGLAVDPVDPEVVYVCAGNGQAEMSDVFKSSDRGVHWTRTHLDKLFHGNGGARWCGERIAVDPFDSRRVLVGTRRDGLWLNPAAGEPGAWSRLDGLPSTAGHVLVVCFDPLVRSRIYAGVANGGFHRSDDGGVSWKAIGGPSDMSRAAFGARSGLYASGKEGVFRYDPVSGNWSDISPRPGAKDWCAIAVAPSDPQVVLAAEYDYSFGTPFWLSRDGGQTWRELTQANGGVIARSDVPWHPSEWFASATSCFAFDPTDANRVWFTDWYATWRSDNLLAQVPDWRTFESGHEEVVGLSLVAPREGAGIGLYSGHADVGGFAHESFAAFPSKSLRAAAGDGLRLLVEITGIAVGGNSPAAAAFVGADGWDDASGKPQQGGLYISSDRGRTLARASGYESEWKWGRVAMSAGDPRNLVVVTRSGGVQFSRDGGSSFQPSAGLLTGGKAYGISGHIFNRIHPLAADAVTDGVFYLLAPGTGDFYRSHDGGQQWTVQSRMPASKKEFIHPSDVAGRHAVFVHAVPARAGHVWVATAQGGLFQSTDGGHIFTQVEGVRTIQGFAIGAPRDAKSYPAIYLFGSVGAEREVWMWRSDDAGVTWTKINDAAHRFGKTLLLAADPSRYGRVFLATGGRGVIAGEPAGPITP